MKNKVNLIEGDIFLQGLEKKLIEKKGKKKHETLKTKYEKELEIMSVLSNMRKARKLSQAKFGRILGVSQQRVSEIEGNSKSITLPVFLELIDALDIELDLVDKKNHTKICKV
jgi:HTH-type transcriptional regulator/antitoxin HipB